MNAKEPRYTQGIGRDDEGTDFGRYRIFPRMLTRNGTRIEIGARAIDISWLLVKASVELVPKDYILKTVWSGVVVEENNLQTQMSTIRRALGPERDMDQDRVPSRDIAFGSAFGLHRWQTDSTPVHASRVFV
ncbi:winged helix-turn-helix domain-containing protein [Martelella limonii]|uniref:winged helix-turn-helix domain-containing protein n=1 Tax=Martelella limonii TaxID=1647649 RepID=UPI0015803A13|nr:winged helix-turn-helix domain-containing protein [Martelella limonii]